MIFNCPFLDVLVLYPIVPPLGFLHLIVLLIPASYYQFDSSLPSYLVSPYWTLNSWAARKLLELIWRKIKGHVMF